MVQAKGWHEMPQDKKVMAEQIMGKLCEAEVGLAQGNTMPELVPLPERRGDPGHAQAEPVSGLREGVHAADAAGGDDGIERGRLRGLLPRRPIRPYRRKRRAWP